MTLIGSEDSCVEGLAASVNMPTAALKFMATRQVEMQQQQRQQAREQCAQYQQDKTAHIDSVQLQHDAAFDRLKDRLIWPRTGKSAHEQVRLAADEAASAASAAQARRQKHLSTMAMVKQRHQAMVKQIRERRQEPEVKRVRALD